MVVGLRSPTTTMRVFDVHSGKSGRRFVVGCGSSALVHAVAALRQRGLTGQSSVSTLGEGGFHLGKVKSLGRATLFGNNRSGC